MHACWDDADARLLILAHDFGSLRRQGRSEKQAPAIGAAQVLIDGTPVGSPSALVPGTNSSTYSLTVPAPGTVGNHTVSIAYTPGAGFAAPGLLPSTTITVGPATTAFAITTVPSPASAGGPLNVTGVATSTNGPPTGTVQVEAQMHAKCRAAACCACDQHP
jgi:hypothetical protein